MTARVQAHTAERRELAHALLDWAQAARRDPGALGSHVYEDIETPGVFYMVSDWASRQAWDAHVGGPEFGIVLGALELLAQPPHVTLADVSGEGAANALSVIRRLRDRTRRVEPHR
jgi:quinol monooxygenase YgiN